VRIAQDTLLSALFLLPPTLVGVATIAEAIFDAAWITSAVLLSAGFLIVPTAIVCGWEAARSASFGGPYRLMIGCVTGSYLLLFMSFATKGDQFVSHTGAPEFSKFGVGLLVSAPIFLVLVGCVTVSRRIWDAIMRWARDFT